MPTVSVVVPAHDASAFIEEAVTSVLDQTFRDFELIVVNDGSSDTPALERALEPHAGCLRYMRQENRGPSGARNRGIREARGELVAFLDADDAWKPEFLESQLRFLRERSGIDLVYSDARIVGDGPLAGDRWMDHTPSERPVTAERLVATRSVVLTSTVLARKRSLIEAGLFDERFTHSEDFHLWLRVLLTGGRIDFQRRVLARRRYRPGSLSARPGSILRGQIEVLDAVIAEHDLPSGVEQRAREQIRRSRAQIDLLRAKRSLRRRDYDTARERLRDANRTLRSPKLTLIEGGLRIAPSLVRVLQASRRRPAETAGAADE